MTQHPKKTKPTHEAGNEEGAHHRVHMNEDQRTQKETGTQQGSPVDPGLHFPNVRIQDQRNKKLTTANHSCIIIPMPPNNHANDLAANAEQTRRQLKEAMLHRHGLHTGSLASAIDQMKLYAMPWDEADMDDIHVDYPALPTIHLPTRRAAIAFPNMNGAPGMPNTKFLIVCTPLDSDSLAFELIADLGGTQNQRRTQEEILRRNGINFRKDQDTTGIPRCIGLHAGILTIDRTAAEFYTSFNLIHITCGSKKEETILRHHLLHEPFVKCSACQTFQDVESTNILCYMHSVNVHTIAHLTIKALQEKQQTIKEEPR